MFFPFVAQEPSWRAQESARLCIFITDPRHDTAVGRLYNRAICRTEIDNGIHVLWPQEFGNLFHSETLSPSHSPPTSGVTQSLVLSLNPLYHRNTRHPAVLKSKCSKMRSQYTAAKNRFEMSGRGTHDSFQSILNVDPYICYMHYFFHLPALGAIVRDILFATQAESGLVEVRSRVQLTHKMQRRSSVDSLMRGLGKMASRLSQTERMHFPDNAASASATGRAFVMAVRPK